MIKIMIVEDDYSKCNDVLSFINSNGIHAPAIHVVSNVADALKNLRSHKYDIVVLDLNLPLRSGDVTPIQDGGKKILYSLTGERYITPTYVLGLTQFEDYQISNTPDFQQFDFNIYSYNNDQWKDVLKNKIHWLIKNLTNNADRITNKKILVLTHGIMTSGNWTRKIETYLEDTDLEVIKFPYPHYSALKIIFPWTRRKILEGYKKFIENIFINNPECELNFLSHSFGTFMTVKSLDESDISYLPNINNVLLCGSVLRTDYDINSFINKFNIKNFVNECGINDLPLIICNLSCHGLGHAGRIGFQGYNKALHNRFHVGGHSDFFENKETLEDWMNIIKKQTVFKKDERNPSNYSETFESILNLISPFTKIIISIFVFFFIFAFPFCIYKLISLLA